MDSSVCFYCGEMFWTDDPEDEKCINCIESPNEQQNRERAVEQYSAYIRSRERGSR